MSHNGARDERGSPGLGSDRISSALPRIQSWAPRRVVESSAHVPHQSIQGRNKTENIEPYELSPPSLATSSGPTCASYAVCRLMGAEHI